MSPEPADSWGPRPNETEDCAHCGRERHVEDLRVGSEGYVCLSCDLVERSA